MARLAEIAREYEEPLRGKELLKSRLRWEDWETLRKGAVAFAREEIRRRRWRGRRGGILPGACDAEDIADHAIAQVLAGNCRLVIGFLREKVANELKRLISQRVRVLHGLKETSAVRDEWEETAEAEENAGVLDGVIDESSHADENELGMRRQEIESVLAVEPALRQMFGLLWDGLRKPSELAARLGIEEKDVSKLRKRLDRRLRGFAKRRLLTADY